MIHNTPALLMIIFGSLTILAGLIELRSNLLQARIRREESAFAEARNADSGEAPVQKVVISNALLASQNYDIEQAILTLRAVIGSDGSREILQDGKETKVAIGDVDIVSFIGNRTVGKDAKKSALIKAMIDGRARRMRPGILATRASASLANSKPTMKKTLQSSNEEASHQPI